MPLVEMCSASASYGSKVVFSHVNLRVNTGEIMCIIGPNGCGKTTLLDSLLGTLKLNSGKIYLNGIDICKLSRKSIACEMAYVPQSHIKTFPYTVLNVVLMGRAARIGALSGPSSRMLLLLNRR